jgi:hypothetical protein
MSGSALMSDRLDIVRLIDAKVTSTRRTVTRSKQLAEAARGDLHIHEDWLRQHRERSEEDLRRHQRRMKRQQRFQTSKNLIVSIVLFVPRLCVSLYRGVVFGLRTLDDLFFSGCTWAGRTAYSFCRSLIGLLSGGVSRIGAKGLTLGLVLVAAFWLMLSSLGKGAFTLGLALIGATSRGLAWFGPKAASAGQRTIASLSQNLSRGASAVGGVGRELGSGAKQQASRLAERLRKRTRAGTLPQKTVAPPPLYPGRLQQAAFIRLRAEHERLQARIHAMDRRYEERRSMQVRETAKDWVELRRLALNAQRLFDVQQEHVAGPNALRTGAAVALSPIERPHHPIHPLQTGRSIGGPPAVIAAGQRRGPAP